MGPSGPNPKAPGTKYEVRWTKRPGEPPRPAPESTAGLEVPRVRPCKGAKRLLTLAYLADGDSGAAGSVGAAGAGTTGSGASGGPQP
jgi:hypothetical protein